MIAIVAIMAILKKKKVLRRDRNCCNYGNSD